MFFGTLVHNAFSVDFNGRLLPYNFLKSKLKGFEKKNLLLSYSFTTHNLLSDSISNVKPQPLRHKHHPVLLLPVVPSLSIALEK